jgi:hypothetical protein
MRISTVFCIISGIKHNEKINNPDDKKPHRFLTKVIEYIISRIYGIIEVTFATYSDSKDGSILSANNKAPLKIK